MIALLLVLLAAPPEKEATYYYTDAYSPNYLLRTRPWQSVAVDSKGLVYVAQPLNIGAGNKGYGSGQLLIYNPAGDIVAQLKPAPRWLPTAGIAVDERAGRIYLAADFQAVHVYDWKGPGTTPTPAATPIVAKRESGRCAGVSLGRNGFLYTADLAENKVFRFYSTGDSSSFGSGPGSGEQGFNHIRRVFEHPVTGNLYVLDHDGVRMYSPIGGFLKRIGEAGPDGILALRGDGTLLIGHGRNLLLSDGDGKVLKTFPPLPYEVLDAALGNDGRLHILPRGEEYAYAAHDAEGKLLHKHGADFDRLKVALSTTTLTAGKPVPARVEFTNGLQEGLLSGAEKKTAEARASTVSVLLRSKSGGTWQKLAGLTLPADAVGPFTLRFTTGVTIDAPGATLDFDVVSAAGP